MTVSLATRGYVNYMNKVVQQVPLTPAAGQNILIKSLETIMPPTGNESLGIHQSDIIIRTAIIAAMADMRANPILLDFVFAGLPKDGLTFKDYGEKSLDEAKSWFLKTEIPVSMVPRIDEGRWPRITISLAESTEAENTLGDVHYESIEYDSDGNWPILAGPFTPVSYDAMTGKIVFPESVVSNLYVAPNMSIIDNVGRSHLIVGVDDPTTAYILAGTIVDLRDAIIKGVKPMNAIHLESANFKESYHIGVHVGSKPVYLSWLHSIVQFALLRYRQALLEARGFERTYIVSSDFRREEEFEAELVFSRYITISGFVRQYWPKDIKNTINSVCVETTNSQATFTSSAQSVSSVEIDLDSDGIGKKT